MSEGRNPLFNWTDIDTVLLDMDGTLLDLAFDSYFWLEIVPRRYSQFHDVELQRARQLLAPMFREKEGTLDWYRLAYWTAELGIDVAELERQSAHLIRLHDGTVRFLEHLSGLDKRMLLVTNAHHESLSIKMDRTGIAGYFEALCSSHVFGVPKEEKEFWFRFGEAAGFDKTRTVLIDDNVKVLDAARLSGIARLVAVRCPDSSRPARDVDGFDAVDDLMEMLDPARTGICSRFI